MSPTFTFQKSGGEKPRNYDLLEPGWYTFDIVKAYDFDRDGKPLVSRNGTAYLKLMCQEQTTEVVIFHYLFLAEEQAARVSAFLSAIGFQYDDGQEVNLEAETFANCLFRGKVENAPSSDGVTRNKIVLVGSPPEPDPVLDAEIAQALEPDPTPEPAPEKEKEDEVPF